MQWQEHYQLIPSHYKEGGPMPKGIIEDVVGWGGGGRAYFGILPLPLLVGALLGKHLYPKQVVNWLGPLDAC